MYATICSLIISIFILLNPKQTDIKIEDNLLGIILITIASLFIILLTISLVLSWGPLQKAEYKFTPRVLEMLKTDHLFSFFHIWLLVFPLFSYAFGIDMIFLNQFNKTIVLGVWILLLGISIDFLYLFLKKILQYINPFTVLQIFQKKGIEAVQKDQQIDFMKTIDAFTEIAIKGIKQSSTSLSQEAISQIPIVTKIFLEAEKSISHKIETENAPIDKVTYVLYYIFQKLDLIHQKASENHLEPLCCSIINVMGKLVVYAADLDITLAAHPLQYIGKFTKRTTKYELDSLRDHASLTLVEVAKSILADLDITYLELKEPFLTLISQLEEIAEETFKEDKSTRIDILLQPFFALRSLFLEGKPAKHPDTPIIVQDIDRVINEFQTLQTVMRTIPKVPNLTDEG